MQALGPNGSIGPEKGRYFALFYDKVGKIEDVMKIYERLKLGLNP